MNPQHLAALKAQYTGLAARFSELSARLAVETGNFLDSYDLLERSGETDGARTTIEGAIATSLAIVNPLKEQVAFAKDSLDALKSSIRQDEPSYLLVKKIDPKVFAVLPKFLRARKELMDEFIYRWSSTSESHSNEPDMLLRYFHACFEDDLSRQTWIKENCIDQGYTWDAAKKLLIKECVKDLAVQGRPP